MEGVGQRLRQRARELGLSDTKVAERLEIAQQRYSNYVADKFEPDLATLVRICHELRMRPDEVLGFEPSGGVRQDETDVLRHGIAADLAALDPEDLQVVRRVVGAMIATRRQVTG